MGLETIEFNLVIVMTSEKFGGVGVVVGFVLVLVLFFRVTGGKQSQLLLLRLRLKFDNSEYNGRFGPIKAKRRKLHKQPILAHPFDNFQY